MEDFGINEEDIRSAVLQNVKAVNGDDIIELAMKVADIILMKVLKDDKIVERNTMEKIRMHLEDGEVYKEASKEISAEKNGVYVYCCPSLNELVFERFSSFDDAVRDAVKRINANILFNGRSIQYDSIDDKTAYYYDPMTDKNMLVFI